MHRKASYMQTIRDHILHRNLWSFIPFPVISSLQKSSSYLMPVEFPAGTEHFMSRDLSHVRIQTDRSVNSVIILILGFLQIFQRQEADFSDSFFCRHFDYLIWFAFALFYTRAVRKIRLLEHILQDSHFCLFWKLQKAVDILLFFSYIYSSLPAICSIHLNIIFPDKKCIDIRCFLIILIIQNSLANLCRLLSNIDRRLRSGPGDH